jgi:hypothetical protein
MNERRSSVCDFVFICACLVALLFWITSIQERVTTLEEAIAVEEKEHE